MEKGLKVLLVASESAPFVKSGGLGDVVGSLPKALQKKNVDVRVVIPRHRVIKNETMYGENLTFIYNGENREPRFW